MISMRRLVLLFVIAACTSDPPPPSGPGVTSHITSFEVPAASAPKLDLIVALDDTMPMAAYADRLVALGHTLAAGPSRDIHFVLTTTTGYEELESTPHYFAPPTQNFSGSLDDALANAFTLDLDKTAPPALLANMQSRVSTLPVNNFVRDDAYLAVLIVSASDDASATSDYAAWIKSLKPAAPDRIIVAAIAPASAPNIDALLAAFPNRTARVAITNSDWSAAIDAINSLYKTTLGVVCMPEPIDLLPDVAGAQIDCSVSGFDETNIEHVLPMCTDEAKPCWSIDRDPQICFEPEPSKLSLGGGFAWFYHPAIRGQCVTK